MIHCPDNWWMLEKEAKTMVDVGVVRQDHIEHQGRDMEEFVRKLEPGSRLAVEATGKSPQYIVDEALAEHSARLGF